MKAALCSDDSTALALARKSVDAAKVALGERGAVWWLDGAPQSEAAHAHNGFWSGVRESNPSLMLGKHGYYHYTNPAAKEILAQPGASN